MDGLGLGPATRRAALIEDAHLAVGVLDQKGNRLAPLSGPGGKPQGGLLCVDPVVKSSRPPIPRYNPPPISETNDSPFESLPNGLDLCSGPGTQHRRPARVNGQATFTATNTGAAQRAAVRKIPKGVAG